MCDAMRQAGTAKRARVTETVAGSSSCCQATDLSRLLAHSLSPAYRATRHFNVNGVVFHQCRTRLALPGRPH